METTVSLLSMEWTPNRAPICFLFQALGFSLTPPVPPEEDLEWLHWSNLGDVQEMGCSPNEASEEHGYPFSFALSAWPQLNSAYCAGGRTVPAHIVAILTSVYKSVKVRDLKMVHPG